MDLFNTILEVQGNIGQMGAYIGAGLAMIGATGTGAGQGVAAGRAAEAVARNPESESKIRAMLIIGCAIAETAAIYSFIIALLLMFAVGV
jgi:F-type H+-transporting ATPase subunit c